MGLLKMKLPICMVRRKKITTKEGEKTKPVKTLARIISPPHSKAKSVFKILFSGVRGSPTHLINENHLEFALNSSLLGFRKALDLKSFA